MRIPVKSAAVGMQLSNEDRSGLTRGISVSGLILGFAFLASSLGQAQVLTAQYDNARTGANLNERMLTPRNVNVTQFGKLFAFKVDGDVYAKPLYMPDLEVPGKRQTQCCVRRYRERQRVRL